MITKPLKFGPYSPVRQAGQIFFVSGQVGVAEDKTAAQDVVTQTHQALQNISHVLETVGLSLQDVVKTTIYLKDIFDFTAVNEIYESYFDEPRPARSCVEVAGLPRLTAHELLVEIEAVAYRTDPETNGKNA